MAPASARVALFAAVAATMLCASTAQDTMAAVINAMKSQVGRLATQTPANTICPGNAPAYASCLVNTLSAQGQFRTSRRDAGTVGQLAGAWALPPQVMSKLQMLVLAESVAFETFHVEINANAASGQLQEYIGAARRVNGVAEIAIANVRVSSGLRQQYDAIPVRTCKRRFGVFKKCKTSTRYQLRGFRQDEINRITQAMRAAGYQKVVEVTNRAPTSLFAQFFAEPELAAFSADAFATRVVKPRPYRPKRLSLLVSDVQQFADEVVDMPAELDEAVEDFETELSASARVWRRLPIRRPVRPPIRPPVRPPIRPPVRPPMPSPVDPPLPIPDLADDASEDVRIFEAFTTVMHAQSEADLVATSA